MNGLIQCPHINVQVDRAGQSICQDCGQAIFGTIMNSNTTVQLGTSGSGLLGWPPLTHPGTLPEREQSLEEKRLAAAKITAT